MYSAAQGSRTAHGRVYITDFNAGVVTQVNVTGGSNRSDRVDQL
jgi:hypothetical protein